MQPIFLETDRLLIRSATPNDSEARWKFYVENLDFFTTWGPKYPAEITTLLHHRGEIEKEYFAAFTKRAFCFYLYEKEDKDYTKIIGNFNFQNLVLGHFLSCNLGYKMDKNFLGQGLLVEALEAGIDFLFNVEKMHRVEANIMPRNAPSIRVAEKLNFKKEGFSPRYLKINDKWEDHERWCLLNDKLETEI